MSEQTTAYIYRFPLPQRVIHFIVMIGFLMLALTGFSLAFSSNDFFQSLVWIMGGQKGVAFLHRFFAFLTLFCVFVHIFWFLYYKYILKHNWLDHQSIMFRLLDVKHLWHNFLYFLGKQTHPPEFYKYSYMQKLYYWAVFLGMFAMTITGLMHMYPESFSRFLPGYFFNIAQLIHFWEALLAVIVKVAFHAFSEHLRPIIFPADKSIFNGYIPRDVMQKEHTGELKIINQTQNTKG
mgnify:CR=1 FL=1